MGDDILCTECDTGCITCFDSSLICETCSTGYYKSDYECLQCPNGCLKCESLTDCKECDISLHYFLVEAKCIFCDVDNGYFMDSVNCHPCH